MKTEQEIRDRLKEIKKNLRASNKLEKEDIDKFQMDPKFSRNEVDQILLQTQEYIIKWILEELDN